MFFPFKLYSSIFLFSFLLNTIKICWGWKYIAPSSFKFLLVLWFANWWMKLCLSSIIFLFIISFFIVIMYRVWIFLHYFCPFIFLTQFGDHTFLSIFSFLWYYLIYQYECNAFSFKFDIFDILYIRNLYCYIAPSSYFPLIHTFKIYFYYYLL